MTKDILLAAVMGAQGLKGEVKVKVFTAAPDALPRYGVLQPEYNLYDRAGFEGALDRAAAEALKGVQLFVARDALPETGEEEFYHADLIGLDAQDSEGRLIGKVGAIHNFGAGDVMEIAVSDGDTILIAFTRETVPVIRIAEGYIVVAVPEDDEDNDHVE